MPQNAASSEQIEQRLTGRYDTLSPAERMLADHLMCHYPVAGLASMPHLAKAAGVSTPTVLRLVQKLGFRGYPEFQSQLRLEVEARLESPLVKHDRWAEGVPGSHILNRFADAILTNLATTLGRIDHAEFDACADILADPQRQIRVTGGRITHALADYLVRQLGITRPGVAALPAMSSAWPPALLDLRRGDVLVVFDIRRYEASVLQICELAADRGAEIVLFTDPWLSPAADLAQFRFTARVEVPSAWDSSVALLVLVETLLAAVQERTWPETKKRMERLEEIYARAQLFRRSRSGENRRPPNR